MKTAITFIAILFALLAYGMKQDKAKQDSIIDTAMQVEDTIGTRKTLNDIRFNGWERSDWLDNEYIRTLRKYLDDYNNGKISNSNLDPYKELLLSGKKGNGIIIHPEALLNQASGFFSKK